MILKKAMLVSNGNKGLNLTFTGYRKINEQFMSSYDDIRKDKLPVPTSIRVEFKKLRYYFLTMTGLWKEEYTDFLTEDYSSVMDLDEYMNDHEDEDREVIASKMMDVDNLLSKCEIEGYEMRGEEIRIHGTIEIIESKPFKAVLPFINEGDDYAFYTEAVELMKEITAQIFNYMKSDTLELEQMRSILLELERHNPEDIERINAQTDEENLIELMKKLDGQALVFPLEGSKLEQMLEEESTDSSKNETQIVSNNTISEGKTEDHEEVESQNEDVNHDLENDFIDTKDLEDNTPEMNQNEDDKNEYF